MHRDEGLKQICVSYLVGYNYWLGTALGGLVFLMLQYVTGGAWGLLLRRILEASASMVLPLAVLVHSLDFRAADVYEEYGHWTPVHTEKQKLQFKATSWSAPLAVTIKAILYFACWIGMVICFAAGRSSRTKEPTADFSTAAKRWPRPASFSTP